MGGIIARARASIFVRTEDTFRVIKVKRRTAVHKNVDLEPLAIEGPRATEGPKQIDLLQVRMGQNAKRPRHESDENAKKAGAKSDDPLQHWLEALLEDHGESDEHLVSLFKDAEEAERADTNPDQAPEPPELESQQVIETSETSMATFLSTLGLEERPFKRNRFDYYTTQGG